MMKSVLIALAVLLLPMPAAAEEAGQTGLTVGFPGSIGIIWHGSDWAAVRPDFTFTRTQNTSAPPSSLSTSAWAVGFGVSALFYTGEVRDNVRTYVTPRFGYTRTNVSGSVSSSSSSSTHTNNYNYAGSFGMQYSPSKRFAVYGEAGVSYARNDSTATTSAGSFGNTTGWSVGTRAGVGVVLYFE